MYLDIDKIKKLLENEKRSCDRLRIPAKISYSSSLSSEWTWPLDAENIGGGGLQFKSSKPLSKGKKLKLKIEFPELESPLQINGIVVRCEKDAVKKKAAKKSAKTKKTAVTHTVGIKFLKSNDQDRRSFVKYLSEKIFTDYLNIVG